LDNKQQRAVFCNKTQREKVGGWGGGIIATYYITLNLNISTSRPDIKNLFGKFLATNYDDPAKFQPSSLTGMGKK